MIDEERKLLRDIEDACRNIDIHLEQERVFEKFLANITKRRAVERELEIVGEATNNLLKLNPTIAISSARKIVNLRNRVIHSYDNIDETIVWKVVMKDIPILLSEVQQLLSQ